MTTTTTADAAVMPRLVLPRPDADAVRAWDRFCSDTTEDLHRQDPDTTAADSVLAALGNPEAALRAAITSRITPKTPWEDVHCMVRAATLLPRGTYLSYNIEHVTRSGMARWITYWAWAPNGIADITRGVALLTGATITDRHAGISEREAIRYNGCQYSHVSMTVHALGEVLYGDDRALGSEAL